MSEEKKPKKDLRARLGRTIAPNTPGAPPIAAPGGVIAPPAATPAAAPAAGAAAPAVAPKASSPGAVAAPAGVAPPPAAVAPPVMTPPIASPAKMPFGPDIAPPPFAKPAAAAEAPKPEPRKRPIDPFAAQVATSDAVRLVIEEKPLEDAGAEGRRRVRNAIIVTIGVVGGMVLGAGAGTINGRNNLANTGVRDGHAVAEVVTHASEVVNEANTHLEAIANAANGTGAAHPTVNYDEIAALTALENPVHAGAFMRKNYNVFDPATVDDLFEYDRHVQALWEDFTHINNVTTGPARRATLDATAAATSCPSDLGHDEGAATAAITAARSATTDAAHAQYVALVSAAGEGDAVMVTGTLGFREMDFDQTTHQPTGRPFMRAGRTGPGRAFDLWAPGMTIGADPGSHLIPIDGPGSAGVLGERAGAFETFAESLAETRRLMHETLEIQQRLTTALTTIQNTPEAFAF